MPLKVVPNGLRRRAFVAAFAISLVLEILVMALATL